MISNKIDDLYLKQALVLANIRRGFCAPNPAVGAVLVRNDAVLATGYHLASGSPHAEIDAFNNLKTTAQDTTLYVTLEPCCHNNKKTPPCTEAIIKSGIKKVIYGFQDPNPDVAGKGEKTLKAADIQCIHSPLPEIDAFYASYAYWWQHKKPMVTAKLAISLDGKIAAEKGQPIVITGTAAQRFTHEHRKKSDALLTTAKTILSDNPLLNVRLDQETYQKPLYILDRQLTTPFNANIFTTAEKLTFFHAADVSPQRVEQFTKQGARCVTITNKKEGLSLLPVLQTIGADGIHDLWVEAGGRCFTTFAQANLLHYAYIYVAPKLLGSNAQDAFTTLVDFFSKAKNIVWDILEKDAVCKIDFVK